MRNHLLAIQQQLACIEEELKNIPFTFTDTPNNTELMNTLRNYYEQAKWHILEELASNMQSRLSVYFNKKKSILESNGTLLIDYQICRPVDRTLLYMFLEDQKKETFNHTIFEKGIFERSSTSPTIHNPKNYLFLDGKKKDPYRGIQHIRFTFDSLYLTQMNHFNFHDPYLTQGTIYLLKEQEKLKSHILQKNNLTKEEYTKLREFFLRTSPIVIQNLLKKFSEERQNYEKNYNVSFSLTTPFANTNNLNYLIVLQTLYARLLQEPEFKNTILKTAQVTITNVTNRHKKFHEFDLENTNDKNYNLKLSWNPYHLRKTTEERS